MKLFQAITATLCSTLTAALAIAQAPTLAQGTPGGCTLATMRGTLAWSDTSTHNGVANSSSGLESYDGHGNMKYVEFDNPSGTNPGTSFGYGTYTIGSISGISTSGLTSTA